MFFSPFLDCQWTPKGNEIWHRVMKGATHYEMQGRSAASRAPDCSAQDEQRTMLSGLENVGDVGLLAGTSKMRHCHGKEASSNNGTCLQFASDRGLTETTSYLQRFKLWLSFDKIPSNKTFTSPCISFFSSQRHTKVSMWKTENNRENMIETSLSLFCCSSFLDCRKTPERRNTSSSSVQIHFPLWDILDVKN